MCYVVKRNVFVQLQQLCLEEPHRGSMRRTAVSRNVCFAAFMRRTEEAQGRGVDSNGRTDGSWPGKP